MRCLDLAQCAEVLIAFRVSGHEEFLNVAEVRHVMTGGRLTEDEVDVAHLATTSFDMATTVKFCK